jgi:6-pyruvoyl-tetrahydropterin synthase
MVIDFGRVKEALMVIHDEWDHRFILGDDDPLLASMSGLPGLVILDRQPTAENLAEIAHERLSDLLAPLVVVAVTVQETTSCSATVTL